MQPPLVVQPREQRSAHHLRRWMDVDGASVFFDVEGDVLPPPLDLHDYAAVGSIFFAMRQRRPLHVEGRVSQAMLRNLEELQEAWAVWRPAWYSAVPVTASEEVPDPVASSERTGVFAFSGGVDATAALLLHLGRRLRHRRVQPVTAMFIHGMDIPLEATSALQTARAAAKSILDTVQVPLSTVRTNWRETLCWNYPFEFGAGLAACLHQFTGTANVGVIGSDEDYAHLQVPWGSNPVTNPFLSGGAFELQTECGSMTRTARVAMISEYPEIVPKLRVCWEGPTTGKNCGKCEKCIRTQLNFLAAGVEPLCFDSRPTAAQVRSIKTRNNLQLDHLKDIYKAARERGINEPWVSALRLAITRNRVMSRLQRATRIATAPLRRFRP